MLIFTHFTSFLEIEDCRYEDYTTNDIHTKTKCMYCLTYPQDGMQEKVCPHWARKWIPFAPKGSNCQCQCSTGLRTLGTEKGCWYFGNGLGKNQFRPSVAGQGMGPFDERSYPKGYWGK